MLSKNVTRWNAKFVQKFFTVHLCISLSRSTAICKNAIWFHDHCHSIVYILFPSMVYYGRSGIPSIVSSFVASSRGASFYRSTLWIIDTGDNPCRRVLINIQSRNANDLTDYARSIGGRLSVCAEQRSDVKIVAALSSAACTTLLRGTDVSGTFKPR